MSSLANISPNEDMAMVAKVATSYLKTEWKQVTGEWRVREREVEVFPFNNKDTIAVVYKVVFSSLVTEVKKITYGSTKDQDSQLGKWKIAIETLVKMILDLKTFATRTLLTHVMRNSRPFIDYFIKQGKIILNNYDSKAFLFMFRNVVGGEKL